MRLRICNRQYNIRRGDIPGNFGLCEPDRATITIAKDLEEHTNMDADMIVLHEIIHAILYETGMTCLLDERLEEALTHNLAIQLYGLGYRR